MISKVQSHKRAALERAVTRIVETSRRWARMTGLLGLLVGGLLFAGPGAAHAALMFQFEEDGTGDILATMTLGSDTGPFDHSDITAFAFTAAGDAIFGIGVGPFTPLFERTRSDGFTVAADGGLRFVSSSSFVQSPQVDFVGGTKLDLLELGFRFGDIESIGLDRDRSGAGTGDRTFILSEGSWVPADAADVPAPAMLPLLLAGLGIIAVGFRRRK
ncbi:MAG: PEP-CTERM sorting domain-containing protein [Minwuiales bacterium]|nr:PEP-CTERM sorting domain-containing protein [Minwuiales bacterium]